ncbi:V-type ATP synthase subunit D [Stetteria hydrogenophila]
MDPRRVLPTKINLIMLRREEKVIRRIRRVMEEKREVLLHYIRSAAEEYNRYQGEVYKLLDEVYSTYYMGAAEMGVEAVESAAYMVPDSLRVQTGMMAVFAVKTPTFRLVEESMPPLVLPPDVSPYLLEAAVRLRRLLPMLLKLAELEEMIRRLIEELRETQRLINALDYVILPSYEAAIKYVKSVLDERMREEFVRLKMVKRKLEERAAAQAA